MYSQDFIDQVRDASDIVNIVGEHTELKKSGSGLLGLCPFPSHSEKTPSFSVSDLKQAYYCFGCQKHGNVFTFLREMRGMSFPEAVEFLAERAHIPIPEDQRRGPSNDKIDENKTLQKINRLAAEFYRKRFAELPQTHPAKQYAFKRGLLDPLIDPFQIGYSGHSNELARYLQSKRIPNEMSEKLGLIKPSRDGNGFYDLFRDRLMFPIISPMGNHIGFGGRVLDDSLPKYINSPESPLFSKGRTLYGLNETAKYIRVEDCVLVVEGYMDFLGLFSSGIRNVAATLGTALTKEHAQILKRHTKNVIVLFDGDSAGQKASFRSLPILLNEGLYPRAVTLPDKKDPDDFVKENGPDQLKQMIKSAPELFLLFVDHLRSQYGDQPSDKVQLLNEVKSVLKNTSDLALKDLYYSELAKRLSVNGQWLKNRMEDRIPPRELTKSEPKTVPNLSKKSLPAKPVPVAREERMILNLCLWREKYLKELIRLELEDLIINEPVRGVMAAVIEAYRQLRVDFDKLTGILFNKFEDLELITDHLNPKVFNFSEDEGDKLFKDCIVRIKENNFKQRAKELIQGLKRDQDQGHLEQFVNEVKNRSINLTENKS